MGKVKRLELWWQLYRTSLPVRDLENVRPMNFCSTECAYYNIMGPPSYVRSVVDRNVVMQRINLYIVVSEVYWSLIVFVKVFQMKPGKLYTIRNKKQPTVTVWTVEGTAMCFWSTLSRPFAAVCWLLACLCSVTSHSPSYRETDLGSETEGVTPSAILTKFGTQLFSLLLAPARLTMWRHFKSD